MSVLYEDVLLERAFKINYQYRVSSGHAEKGLRQSRRRGAFEKLPGGHFSGRPLQGGHSCFKLAVVQIGIEALLFKQLLMRSALDDIAILKDQDQIGVLNCGKAMRNDK